MFVDSLLTKGTYISWFIGGYCSNAKWKWVTKEKTTYQPYTGFPDIPGTNYSTCLHIQTYRDYVEKIEWQYSYYTSHYYICEWDTSRASVLPDQVTLTSVKKASPTSVNINWKRISDAKGYAVYMKQGKNGTYKKIADIKYNDITTYTARKLKRGKTYYFQVRAFKNIYGERSYGDLSLEKSIKLK